MIPHGYCLRWSPEIVIPWILANAIIFLCYIVIPATMLMVGMRVYETSPRLRRLICWFSGFIALCGVSHAMDIWTLYEPVYWVQVFVLCGTAIVSVGTVWQLIADRSYIEEIISANDNPKCGGGS